MDPWNSISVGKIGKFEQHVQPKISFSLHYLYRNEILILSEKQIKQIRQK